MTNRKPQIISKALIKPSSPTPRDLKTYNLSILDQLAPHFYLPLVLFYPAPDSENSCNLNGIASELKKSLSKALIHYYPFAGRFSGKDFIDCNDEGLDFYEARIDCKLDEILKKPDPETMDLFSPPGMLFNESFQGSPIIIQVTYFSCGGVAISVSMLHKVTDACAMFGFIKDWAAVARGEMVSPPMFLSQVITSPSNVQINIPGYKFSKDNVATRRLSFDPSKLSKLKALISDNSGTLQIQPSRVEVVAALIYKCAMAASKAKTGLSSPSILTMAANLRPRVLPPLPENSVGNFSWVFSIMTNDESDRSMAKIVAALKKAVSGFYQKFGNGLTAEKSYSIVCESIDTARELMRENKSEIEVYRCSSLCRYPFDQMDFGRGKPICAGTSSSKMKNTFHMLDNLKTRGIEALVTLEEDKMAIFEKDEELLSFAVINPIAIRD